MVNKQIFGKTRKKIIKSKKTGLMARFTVIRDDNNGKDDLIVKPIKSILTGNLTGQGRKFVSRYVVIIEAKINAANKNSNLIQAEASNSSTYELNFVNSTTFKTNEKVMKSKIKALTEKNNDFCDTLIAHHFGDTANEKTIKLVLLLSV